MGWPYHILKLSSEQKQQRRALLGEYGLYAQLSPLIPIVVYQLYRLAKWLYSKRKTSRTGYSAVPLSTTESASLARKWRAFVWWLEDELGPGWGSRQQWMAGIVWTLWLLFLCFNQTGEDYIHVTKRFGRVAASQLPLHYMLSIKSRYSPLILLLDTSHERLNPWHRTCGRIIFFLLLLHMTWYLNYFIQAGDVARRLTTLPSITGIVAMSLFTGIMLTSLEKARRWSYRVFYNVHLLVGFLVLPILFLHERPLRLYTLEVLAIASLDRICRKLDAIIEPATISPIYPTNLLKIDVPVPAGRLSRFSARPGQHVYLSIPPDSSPGATKLADILLSNPFTITNVTKDHLTLVVRTLQGPVTQGLMQLATAAQKPLISLEGPYGSSREFKRLPSEVDRILLVAGGVGATFIIPVYRALREHVDAEGRGSEHLTLVWSIRSAGEMGWVLNSDEQGPLLSDTDNARIFITRNGRTSQQNAGMADDGVEMADFGIDDGLLPDAVERHTGRPDLGEIVDETFSHGREERVAIIFCGPPDMGRELRRHVGRWVQRGRDVWWFHEAYT